MALVRIRPLHRDWVLTVSSRARLKLVPMTPAERRESLLSLLSHIDSATAECKNLVDDPDLNEKDLARAAELLELNRVAREQAERLLAKL